MQKTIVTNILITITIINSVTIQAYSVSEQIFVDKVLPFGAYTFIYFKPNFSLANSTYKYISVLAGNALFLAKNLQTNRRATNTLSVTTIRQTIGTTHYKERLLSHIDSINRST